MDHGRTSSIHNSSPVIRKNSSYEMDVGTSTISRVEVIKDRSIFSLNNVKIIGYIVGWYVFSLSISIYNKWMFGPKLDFKFPIIITSIHQFCLFWLSLTVIYFKPSLRPKVVDHEKVKDLMSSIRVPLTVYLVSIFPCSIVSSGDIGLSNFSFKFISLSLYTMLKTSSLIFVLLFSLLFKLEKFNWRLILIVAIMTGSVMMMVSGNDDYEDNSSAIGIVLVLLASLISGLRWSLTQMLLKRNSYTSNPILTMFYLSPGMWLFLLMNGLFIEGWSNFVNSPVWAIKGVFGTIVLLIIPGILAFLMTLFEFQLLSSSKVITLSVAGIFKEVLTIIFSTMIFHDELKFVNYVGLFITFMDILWYNWYRFNENGDGYKPLEDEEQVEMATFKATR